jgi:Zn-dependent M28 family amino/carboxypeptidase
MSNLIVEWHPDKKERVLLCAHYDTRPKPDNDPNPRLRETGTFTGANDGASGVAALMELAHLMPTFDGKYGIDFVLFDGEELVYGGPDEAQQGEYFVGSTIFAREYRRQRPEHRYRWGVLLDMVGDADLQLYQEQYSVHWRDTRPLVNAIWSTAQRLGVEEFVPRVRYAVRDDHLPLNEIARIPTCDIIDFDYPEHPTNVYWHSVEDTPDKCSGESLAKVGWVVYEWLKTAN